MRYATATFACLFSIIPSLAIASDWLTLPSTYSHDPVSGQRVSQFAPIELPTTTTVPNFRTSGYTHTRSALNYRGSMDNYHRVETWGDPVRPYGEWQRPFRPGSVPYDLWGPPFGGLNWHPGPRRGGGWGWPGQPGWPPQHGIRPPHHGGRPPQQGGRPPQHGGRPPQRPMPLPADQLAY